MPKVEENHEYKLAAEHLLDALIRFIRPNDKGAEGGEVAASGNMAEVGEMGQVGEGDLFASASEKALLRLTCALLKIAEGRQDPVKECLINLLLDLRDIRDITRFDVIGRGALINKDKDDRSRDMNYDMAKEHLDQAAKCFDLPAGYFYSHIKERHQSLNRVDKNGVSQIVNCQNYADHDDGEFPGTCEVPRFVGEAFEFYRKRLPPEARGLSWREMRTHEITKVYGVSGGGEGKRAQERRFYAAASVLVGTFVPEEIDKPYQLISDLLKLGAVERSSKRVRNSIVDRNRRSKKTVRGSSSCLQQLREIAAREEDHSGEESERREL